MTSAIACRVPLWQDSSRSCSPNRLPSDHVRPPRPRHRHHGRAGASRETGWRPRWQGHLPPSGLTFLSKKFSCRSGWYLPCGSSICWSSSWACRPTARGRAGHLEQGQEQMNMAEKKTSMQNMSMKWAKRQMACNAVGQCTRTSEHPCLFP